MSYGSAEKNDILYYNVSIDNTGNTVSGKTYGNDALQIDANIQANNNQPIVENPADWYGSIVRMEVPGFQIPLINIQIKTPINSSADINTMINSFTLGYGNTYTNQINLIWTPQVYSTVGQTPSYVFPAEKQIYDPYYYCYNYQTWVNMMNTALKTAMTELKALVPAVAGSQDPFFYYDATTQLFSLYAPTAYFDSNLPNYITIYFNSVSSFFFNGFYFNEKSVGSANGTDEYFIIQNYNNINTKTIGGNNYIVLQQEFCNLAYISPLKSIILSTNMNVVSEIFYINNPRAIQNNQFINVLTDFLPDLSGGNEAGVGSKIFIYNASSLWRLFQFVDRQPLYKFSVDIFWADVNNNITRLQLPKGLQANIKMMFINKNFYSTTLLSFFKYEQALLASGTPPQKEEDILSHYENPRFTGFPRDIPIDELYGGMKISKRNYRKK